MPAKKPKQSTDAQDKFIWADEETELLLGVVSEYKAKKQIESSSDGESVFWDSVPTKYKDIADEFTRLYAIKKEQNAEIRRLFWLLDRFAILHYLINYHLQDGTNFGGGTKSLAVSPMANLQFDATPKVFWFPWILGAV